MYQFFVESEQVSSDRIHIYDGDVNHIKNVLRMKGGERIRISDKSGCSYFCHIESMDDQEVIAIIDEKDELGTELPNKIYLFQGLPKGDKMELIIQKSVELGVFQIIPVSMRNCVMKLEEKKAPNKIARWNTIAESAAKQSKRTIIPEVTMPMTYKQAMAMASEMDVVLLPYENERGMQATREIIGAIEPGQSIAIFVGPEGGFAKDEIEGLKDSVHKISLGRRILRTETAGLATLSMLVYELDY